MRPIDSSNTIDTTGAAVAPDLTPQVPVAPAPVAPSPEQPVDTAEPGTAAAKRLEQDLAASYFRGQLGQAQQTPAPGVLYDKPPNDAGAAATETKQAAPTSAGTGAQAAGQVPPPPPIGDGTSDELNQDVAAAAAHLVGQHVIGPNNQDYSHTPDKAECFYMVDVLLRGAGAKSAADIMGSDKVTPKADYKWGDKKVDLKDVKPGDVLQFKDHKIVIKTRTTTKKTYPDGHSVVEQGGPPDETLQRGHHSAVVLANDGNGKMTVAEQHVLDHSTNKETSTVRKNQLFTQGATTTYPTTTRYEGNVKIEETKTVTISVTGEISAYRPQKK